jgi:hypothetical protein
VFPAEVPEGFVDLDFHGESPFSVELTRPCDGFIISENGDAGKNRIVELRLKNSAER